MAKGATIWGEGPVKAKIAIIGGVPNRAEVREGRPFAGPHGALLRQVLDHIGAPVDKMFLTNVVPVPTPAFRRPTASELEKHKGHIGQALAGRSLVVALGAHAAEAVLGREVDMLKDSGVTYPPPPRRKAQVLVLHDPGFVLRNRDDKTLVADWIAILKKTIKKA